jgi:two-component system CheB/CheR fusion protein
MLVTHAALFTPSDVRHRIFTKVVRLQLRERMVLLAQSGSAEATNQVSRQLRARELISEGTPHAQMVVDSQGFLITANAPARVLFGIPEADLGRPLKDLEISYKPIDLRSPIDRVARDRRPLVTQSIQFARPDGSEVMVDINVTPLIDDDGSLVGTVINVFDVSPQVKLRADLEQSRQDLQSNKEELETTSEELQSTVEELETTNEELQSTNEELETLNEELESTNAELQSINTDLQLRRAEVERLNVLLLAITGNIEVGAAVLDRSGRIQVWNERAADLWGVSTEEVLGSSFFDLDIGLPTDELKSLVRQGTGGDPRHAELTVAATTRRGRQIRCRVIAHTLGDGEAPAGVVVVMEELQADKAAKN